MKAAPTVYALTAPAAPATAPPAGEIRTEVAVVGGGITGLSAALHLAEAGRAVCVLEAGTIGAGASGRNGGHVNPGLKPDPDAVLKHFGAARGAALAEAAWNAPDLVFELIARHGMNCEAARGGTLRAAMAAADAKGLRTLAAQCAARGWNAVLLDQAQMSARSGTEAYLAGLLDRRGGQINPLAYARELAAASVRFGAVLCAPARIDRMASAGAGWALQGAGFTVQADQVVLATNGYTDGLWPKLRRTVVPLFSGIIASSPLPARLCKRVLAEREVLYELGAVTTYYRVDAAGRMVIGGRSRSRDMEGPAAFGFLARHARRLWPEMAGLEWTHGWNGRVAMTTDHLPHWHEPAAGVIAALGYNGRGNAMATLLGREVARRVTGTPAGELLLPPAPIRPIPLHSLWPAAVAARIVAGRVSGAGKARALPWTRWGQGSPDPPS